MIIFNLGIFFAFMKNCLCRISKKDDLINVFDLGNHYMCGEFPQSISEKVDKGKIIFRMVPK